MWNVKNAAKGNQGWQRTHCNWQYIKAVLNHLTAPKVLRNSSVFTVIYPSFIFFFLQKVVRPWRTVRGQLEANNCGVTGLATMVKALSPWWMGVIHRCFVWSCVHEGRLRMWKGGYAKDNAYNIQFCLSLTLFLKAVKIKATLSRECVQKRQQTNTAGSRVSSVETLELLTVV